MRSVENSVSRSGARKGRATSPVCGTRTPCQQVEARTDSRGRYAYAAEYGTHGHTASHAHSDGAQHERARGKTLTHTNRLPVDQPAPGNFCCATERPSRNLAYARLAATAVPSARGTLHRRRRAPHTVGTQRRSKIATHTRPNVPNQRTTYEHSPRLLARPRSTVRTTVPTTTESSRVQPESRERARRNLPRERNLSSTTTAT